MHQLAEAIWYGRHPLAAVLLPLAWLYQLVMALRRAAYRRGLLPVVDIGVPVVVVGNLTVGGTGKTPLVIHLVELLQRHGYRPGVLSRGYRGRAGAWPQQVRSDSDPVTVGDEAIVLARHCQCPIAAGPDRIAAARALLAHADCDVLISDDGLQHYRMARQVEIAVVDGVRRFGNGRCLPAGPLREPLSRLRRVDLVVCNGPAGRGEFAMTYVPRALRNLRDPDERVALATLRARRVHAVAGIGHPDRFFQMLVAHGLQIVPHAFPDHHAYRLADVSFADELPVVMTEKDAVKIERMAGEDYWYVPIEVELPATFEHRFLAALRRRHAGQATA